MSDLVETYAGTVTPWWAGRSATAKSMYVLPGGAEVADVDDLFVKAELDGWDVRKQPLMIGGEHPMVAPDVEAIQRMKDGAYLGHASPGYPVVQNEVLLDFGKALMGGGLRATTALSIMGGRVVSIVYDVPLDEITIPGDPSPTKVFLLTRNGFDAAHALGAHVTPIRTVCWNTQVGAINASWASVYLRHTSNMADRLDVIVRDAQRTLGLIPKAVERWTASMVNLTKRPISLAEFEEFVVELLPVDPQVDRPFRIEAQRRDLVEVYTTSPLLDGLDSTAYRAFSAVTEWTEHARPYSDTKRASGADRRAESVMDGWAAKKKDRALVLLAKA